MSEEEKIISVNEEDILNFVNCYKEDIEYIKQLEQENKKLQQRINKAIEYIKIYRSYQKNDNKDYLKGRDEIGCLDICQVDELLDILKEVE